MPLGKLFTVSARATAQMKAARSSSIDSQSGNWSGDTLVLENSDQETEEDWSAHCGKNACTPVEPCDTCYAAEETHCDACSEEPCDRCTNYMHLAFLSKAGDRAHHKTCTFVEDFGECSRCESIEAEAPKHEAPKYEAPVPTPSMLANKGVDPFAAVSQFLSKKRELHALKSKEELDAEAEASAKRVRFALDHK